MRILKNAAFAVFIIVLASLAHTWVNNSAYMKSPPKVDVREMLPRGLRISGGASGDSLNVDDYRGAGIRYFRLAKNLDIIISMLGLEYLNSLRGLRGRDDGYVEWSESPIDVQKLKRDSPIVVDILVSLRKTCKSNTMRKYYCTALNAAETGGGVYYTYGTKEIVFLQANSLAVNIAFAGPFTGKR